MAPLRRFASQAGPPAAAALALAGLFLPGLELAAALLSPILALGATRSGRARVLLLLLPLSLLPGASAVQAWLTTRGWAARAAAELDGKVASVEGRARVLLAAATVAADRAAALPEASRALSGDTASLSRLFGSLGSLQGSLDLEPALAVHDGHLATLAWSGRVVELQPLRRLLPPGRALFVLEGTLATTLIATAPVPGPAGAPAGLASAEIPLAAHRNLQNEYLKDFDRLVGDDSDLEVRYFDLRDIGEEEHPFAALPPDAAARTTAVKTPEGEVLASVRARPPRLPDALARQRGLCRHAAVALAALLLVGWTAGRPLSRARLALGATALRVLLLLLGPPFLDPAAPLLSAEAYSSSPPAGIASEPLGALLHSPLDLLLTSSWLCLLAALGAGRSLAVQPRRAPLPRVLAVDVAALPALAAPFAWIYDTTRHSNLDLEAFSLLPRDPVLLAMQWSLLLSLASGFFLLLAVFALAGPLPLTRRDRVFRLGSWLALGTLAYRLWPRDVLGLPLLPALALLVAAALLAGSRAGWEPALRAASPDARAALAVAAVALLALLVHPSLVHYGEKATRFAAETEHAPLVLRQPQWREHVLREARREIDALNLLESSPGGAHPPEIEELAFAAWSATDLAAFGFSSAVEIQDASGYVVSRFASNLPSLGGSRRPLPRSPDWEASRERFTIASSERLALHARRLLRYDGRLQGAVHVYVGEDYWNLPFLSGSDPYAVLYRRVPRTTPPPRPLGLLVYDSARRSVFSSADRPPALEAGLVSRLRGSPAGLWSTLMVDGRAHHVFLFTDGRSFFGVTYPRLSASRHLADTVEAVASLTLGALALALGLLAVRSALRRPSLSLASLRAAVAERFALRLFVAFIAVALVPVAVLQALVGRFVAERLRQEAEAQALDVAAVARKAVEDFALFQRDEAPGQEPVNDAALVWVASLTKNDLDVFDRGRLLASSKRELYASGLLSPRAPGTVFRSLALDGQPWDLRTETIGGFSYRVVSVPVRLDASEQRILAMPLASRQREVEGVVGDLERTIRLASVLFLGAAAAVAHSLSRRISGPIRELTEATRRVASGDLDARVHAQTRDELMRLMDSFNRMAEELQRQRRDLERSNRLAAWAEMARAVAHEVKNPLTPIQLSAEHLRRVFGDASVDFGRTLETCTDTILQQVRTLREIVTEFSSFARPPAPVLEPVALAPLLERIAARYTGALPRDVRFELLLEDRGPLIEADRRLLERAVLNLVENALQAVGEAGRVRLRLRAEADGMARVEVEDTGPGLDPAARERIFEPFFSTKAAGSGLGLALVKKIVEDHGGTVALHSEPGQPTCATLRLPVATRRGAATP